jgi:hypothetical protein
VTAAPVNGEGFEAGALVEDAVLLALVSLGASAKLSFCFLNGKHMVATKAGGGRCE